jgi:hypothetical protein
MANEAASRSLNYALPSHILDRISRTTGSERNEMASAISTGAQEFATTMSEQEVARRLEDEQQKLKDENADIAYTNGNTTRETLVDTSTFSDKTRSEAEAIEAQQREMYLTSDRVGQNKGLLDQKTRGESLKGLQGSQVTLSESLSGGLIDEDNLPNDIKYIIGAIGDQEATSLKVDNNNQYYYEFIDPDSGEVKKITQGSINKLVEDNLLPTEQEGMFRTAMENISTASAADYGGEYDGSAARNAARKMVTKGNVNKMLTNGDVWGGAGDSFAKHFMDWEGFENMELDLYHEPGSGMDQLDPNNSDGRITKQELTNMSVADRKAVIAELSKPDNFKLAQEVLFDYAVLRGESQWNSSQKAPKKVPGNNNLTAHERDLNRVERDRLSMQQARSKPIILNGLNFGLVTDYYRDETSGEWMYDRPSPIGGPIKVDDIPGSQLPDPDLLKSEIERLEVELDENPLATMTARDLISKYSIQ